MEHLPCDGDLGHLEDDIAVVAHHLHFVIVEITNPRSAPLELQATVPDYMVPFAPILQQGEEPFSMFVDLQNKCDWLLRPVHPPGYLDKAPGVSSALGRLTNDARAHPAAAIPVSA